MKVLLRLFEKSRRYFKDGAPLASTRPIFNALENFFFGPASTTINAPHVRDPLDVKRFMTMVIIALVPSLIAGFYFFGLRMIAMIIVSYAAGGVVEVAFAMIRKEDINEGFLVTGMLFPLIMPPTVPLWMLGIGCAFGVFAGKELFGGTGRNVFNPAIVGRCFLALAYPGAMSGNWVTPGTGLTGRMLEFVMPSSVDAVSQATPLVLAGRGEMVSVWNLFIGNVSGSLGETSALAIIMGGIFLLLTRVANWRSVVATLGSAAVMAFVLHLKDPQTTAPVLWHICAGGLLFGAFFMVTDPVSSPVTNAGKWVYGIVIGTVTILIRVKGGYAEGMMFAILLGNIIAPILDEVVIRMRLRRLQYEA